MPIIIMIIIIINYELLYLQSLYEQSILSMFHRPSFRAVAVFTLYQLLFKISKGKKKNNNCKISTKMFVFVREQEVL